MKFLRSFSKYGFISGVIVAIAVLVIYEKFLPFKRLLSRLNGPKRVFFIESNYGRTFLDSKQLCAIESAAKHNPDLIISVMSVKGIIKEDFGQALLQQYPNVKFELINVTEIFTDTPLYVWWINDRATKVDGYFRTAHISDALRLALVYKHGGFYSDLDTIALRSFKTFYNDSAFFFERDSGTMINSFFHLPPGHPFLKYLMQMFVEEYNPSDWSKTGPDLIARKLPIFCNVSSTLDLNVFKQLSSKTCDLVIYPQRFAYALHWESADHFFESDHTWEIKRFSDAHSLHFHAKRSDNHRAYWNSSNIFDFFAFYNCPLVNDMTRQRYETGEYKY
jgi:lactosylceramide 4-alpha-galactosyltransferase